MKVHSLSTLTFIKRDPQEATFHISSYSECNDYTENQNQMFSGETNASI